MTPPHIWDTGYESSLVLIRPRDKAPAHAGWLHQRPSRKAVESWRGNLGIVAEKYPAIDIDLHDEVLAQRIVKAAIKHLGPAPLRLSHRPASKLLVYRTNQPFKKKVLTLPENKGKVEVLGAGRQYLVWGIHPQGTPYRWAKRALWEIDPEDLMEVTEEQVDAFLDELQKEFGGFVGRSSKTEDYIVPPEELAAPSVENVREVLQAMPNSDAFLADVLPEYASPRDYWVAMGMAIKGAAGDAGEDLFVEWTSRWEDGSADLEDARKVYQGLHPERYGWPLLDKIGRERLFRIDAVDEFEAEDAPPLEDTSQSGSRLELAVSSLHRSWDWSSLLREVASAREVAERLGPDEQGAFEAIVLGKIQQILKSFPAASKLWQARAGPPSPGLELVNGRWVISPADPTAIDWETTYLVARLIPLGAIVEIIADTQMGKTWLLVDLALSVAFGRPFLGRATTEGRVLYLAYEGQTGLWKRIAAWLSHYGLLSREFTSDDLKALLTDRMLVATLPPRFDHVFIEQLLRDSSDEHDLSLVIVDTRGKSLGLDQQEDSADTANHVQGLLSRVAQDMSCTFVSAHHTGLAARDRGRGSSAWTQGADVAFIIDGTSQGFGQGESMVLKAKKFRDDEWPSPISFRLRRGTELAIDGCPFEGAVVERMDAPTSLRLPARVFMAIEQNPGCSQVALRANVGGRKDAADEAVARLVANGAVGDQGVGNRHSYFCVSGWRVEHDGEVRHVGEEFEVESPDAPELACGADAHPQEGGS